MIKILCEPFSSINYVYVNILTIFLLYFCKLISGYKTNLYGYLPTISSYFEEQIVGLILILFFFVSFNCKSNQMKNQLNAPYSYVRYSLVYVYTHKQENTNNIKIM